MLQTQQLSRKSTTLTFSQDMFWTRKYTYAYWYPLLLVLSVVGYKLRDLEMAVENK